MRRLALFLVVLFPFLLNAQKLKRADKVLIQNLENHIKFLASDELEGRRAGTPGEQKAVDYIIAQYQKAGIQAKGANGFIQSFPIDEGKKLSAGSFIKVNKQSLLLDSSFFPISNSGSGNIKSMASVSLNEVKQIWFKDVNNGFVRMTVTMFKIRFKYQLSFIIAPFKTESCYRFFSSS